jgi:hypothetical protein
MLFTSGCGADSNGFFYPALGLSEGRILVTNATVTPAAHTVTMYDLNGRFISIVKDVSAAATILRGMAIFDPLHIIVSTDTPDQLSKLNIFTGEFTDFSANALLTGNIYDVVGLGGEDYVVAESNTIERFSGNTRIPTAGNPYINTTLGACVLSTPRGMAKNSSGHLIVASNVNNRLLRYNVSSTTSSCIESNASFGANLPIPVVAHSDGNIYFGTQTNDAIYSLPENFVAGDVATSVLSANASINNPLAMAVLPNGNLLVASDGIDTIIEMTTAGTVVNPSFIKDAFTSTVTAILVIRPQ